MDKVLVVEDAESLRDVLSSVLEGEGFQVVSCGSAEQAREILAKPGNSFDCILADFRLPGESGIDLLKDVRERDPSVPYVIMTAYGSIDIAIEAMKLGANDFLCKPFEPETLTSAIRDIIRHRRIVAREHGLSTKRGRIIQSTHPSMQVILSQARKVAAVDSSVLILGESGTGKELLARYIHEHSERREKPFIAINCAALPAELLESEFFGHEAGAYTGATQSRSGVFEIASEGTIFLDEIGDMPLQLQVKLLRALQEREIKRLGGNRTIQVNPRILSATNHDVEDAIKKGSLREDFFYRLAVISFSIPPLRERPSDIELLANYFLQYFSEKLSKQLCFDEQAMDFIRSYAWPGNARELENVVERASILADKVIQKEHLGVNLTFDLEAVSEAKASLSAIATSAARQAEIELIRRALDKTRGNKTKAAHILGVSYKTLLNKVKEYQLESGAIN